ncbi:hypothetical protein CMV_009025, partial [Castanea mollissima]
ATRARQQQQQVLPHVQSTVCVRFHYDPNFVASEEVRVRLYEVIERTCPTTLERCRIDLQLEKFDKAEGLFGIKKAILTRTKKQPESNDEWITKRKNLAC